MTKTQSIVKQSFPPPKEGKAACSADRWKFCDTDMLFFLLFSIVFVTTAFNQFDIGIENNLSTTLAAELSAPLGDTTSVSTQTGLIEKISNLTTVFLNKEVKIRESLFLTSKVRYTYRQVKFESKKTRIPNFTNLQKWKVNSIEPHTSFNEDHEISSADHYSGVQIANFFVKPEFSIENSFLKKGGYYWTIDKNEIISRNDQERELRKAANRLLVSSTVNINTALFVFDAVLIDFETNYLIPLRLFVSANASGIIKEVFEINFIPKYRHDQNFPLIFYFEIFLILVVLLYSIYFFVSRYRKAKRAYKEQREKHNKKVSFWLSLKEISSFDSFLTFFSLLLSLITIILGFIYFAKLRGTELISEQEFKEGKLLSLEANNNLHELGYMRANYKIVIVINALLIFLRLVTKFSQIAPRMKVFFSAAKLAKEDLFGFFFFFGTIWIGISTFTYFYYGNSIKEFTQFPQSLNINLQFIVGSVQKDLISQMREHSVIATAAYFLTLTILVKFTVLRMILAIILYYFKISNDAFETDTLLRKSIAKTKEEIKASSNHYFFKIVNLYNIFVTFGFSKAKKKYLQQSKIEPSPKEEEQVQSKKVSVIAKIKSKAQKEMLPSDFHNYSLEFYQDYSVDERDAYFESDLAELKIKDYYESKYKKIFYYLYFYIVFAFFSLVSLTMNNPTAWNYSANESLLFSLNLPGENFEIVWTEANTFEDISNYIYTEFIAAKFVKVNDILIYKETARVVGGSIMVTSRTALPKEGFEGGVNVRSVSSTSPAAPFDYDKEDISGSFKEDTGEYMSMHESYGKKGGMVAELKPEDLESEELMVNTLFSLISEFTNSVTTEFITYNFDNNFLLLQTFGVSIEYGGKFSFYEKVEYVPLGFTSNEYERLAFTYLVLHMLILLVFAVFTIKQIIEANRMYTAWYAEKIVSLNFETKIFRQSLNPEIFRRIRVVLNFSNVTSILVLIFSVAAIIEIAIFKSIGGSLKGEIDNAVMFVFRNKMYSALEHNHRAKIFSGIALLLIGVKFFTVLNLNKYFLLTAKTMAYSLKNNLVFVFLLLLLQPAFIIYSYIAFGSVREEFNSFLEAFVSCMKIMFGLVNFRTYFFAHKSLGLFFYYAYVFTINIFLLNVFVAIIDRSYLKAVVDINKINEKYDLKRILFPCCFKKRVLKKAKNDNSKPKHVKERNYFTKMSINLEVSHFSDNRWIKDQLTSLKLLREDLIEMHEFRRNLEQAHAAGLGEKGKINKFESENGDSYNEAAYLLAKTHFLFSYIELGYSIAEQIFEIERREAYLHRFIEHNNFGNQIIAFQTTNEQGYKLIMELEDKLDDLLIKHNKLGVEVDKRLKEERLEKKKSALEEIQDD